MTAPLNACSQAGSEVGTDRQAQLTMLDLIEAVAEVTDSEAELVSTVAHLVNSGRVRLIGSFRDAWID
jgi:hypothetical protein